MSNPTRFPLRGHRLLRGREFKPFTSIDMVRGVCQCGWTTTLCSDIGMVKRGHRSHKARVRAERGL